MKEVEKKDAPEISGGQSSYDSSVPTTVLPYPTYPQTPGGPIDLPDPLTDLARKKQVQS